MSNASENLNITKIKLGSGDDYKYYTPQEDQADLKGPLGLEFYVYNKELLEDETTISFHTIITEEIGGFDIREVGLYETINGVDYLFAISTQQPFVKPSPDYNYYINLDYYMFIKDTHFAEVYDQITLDVEHALVTEADMEELMRSFLFAQGNLMNQIGNNSRIIGYNRATQLYEQIIENKNDFGYVTLYKNYASLIDMTSDNSIFSYWAFNYSRRKAVGYSIVDISKNNYDLSTNQSANLYKQTFEGFMSLLDFGTPNYYKLSSQIPLSLSSSAEERDFPFTMIFALEPLTTETTRTLLAKANYATSSCTFQVQELGDTPELRELGKNNSLEVKLFSDTENYITFYSDAYTIPEGAHSIVLTYQPATATEGLPPQMIAYINSNRYVLNYEETNNYTYMKELPGKLYEFKVTPAHSTYIRETSDLVNKYQLCDRDGNIISESTEWTVENSESGVKVYYNGHEASLETSQDNTIYLYPWTFTPPVEGAEPSTIYTLGDSEGVYPITDNTVLYNQYYEVYEQSAESGHWRISGGQLLYHYGETDYDGDYQLGSSLNYVISYYVYQEEPQRAWTNSVSTPTILYNEHNEELGSDSGWKIEDNKIYYENQEASYQNQYKSTYYPDLTSYIISSDGTFTDYINSNVGLVSIVKEKLSEENARVFALNLCATMGKNPYMSTT